MFVTVRVFNDETRKFFPCEVNSNNVNAIAVDTTSLYGKDGEFICRKVTMPGTVMFIQADDALLLKK